MKQILGCVLLSTSILSADTLVFRNGAWLNGDFMGADKSTVRFEVNNQVKTYNLTDIEAIQFATEEIVTSEPTDPNSYSSMPYPSLGSSQMQLPAGTQIVVRMIDSADSSRDPLGKIYHASVDQPVAMNGQTIIPRGADALVALVDLQQSGRLARKSMLTMDLRSVSVNGHTYELASTSVSQASSSRTARSAKVIGGTAALGAIVGALAGGGKGAAIGASSGAALGTGVEVLTSGQRVRVPPETRLAFTLQSAVNLLP